MPALVPPGLPGGMQPRMDAVPALGQHTDVILAELGLGEAEIRLLRSEHAV